MIHQLRRRRNGRLAAIGVPRTLMLIMGFMFVTLRLAILLTILLALGLGISKLIHR